MNKKSALVLRGLLELPKADRQEAIEMAQEFDRLNMSNQKEKAIKLSESVKAEIGPLSGGFCPCCGK